MIRNVYFSALFSLFFLSACTRDTAIEKGTVCLQLGDYTMAIGFFTAALHENPGSYDARLGLGKALLQRSIDRNDTVSWNEALVQLEAARTLNPSQSLDALLSQTWSERARLYLRDGDTVSAISALSRAIESDTRSIEPINLAGIVYYRIGEVEKSRILFTKALSIDSTNVSTLFNIGMVEWNSGNAALAHDYWFRALKKAPDDDDIMYWFALAEKEKRESQE